jgi:hypothetical protein
VSIRGLYGDELLAHTFPFFSIPSEATGISVEYEFTAQGDAEIFQATLFRAYTTSTYTITSVPLNTELSSLTTYSGTFTLFSVTDAQLITAINAGTLGIAFWAGVGSDPAPVESNVKAAKLKINYTLPDPLLGGFGFRGLVTGENNTPPAAPPGEAGGGGKGGIGIGKLIV